MDRDNEIDRELRTHLELEAEEQRAAGLSADEARAAARRVFGSEALVTEDVRAVWRSRALEELVNDLRYGLRLLRRNPTFALVAVVTLAIGIGANTAIFSVVDAVLIRPLPYPDSERLAMLWEDVSLPAYRNARNTPAPGNFADWRARTTAFTAVAAIGYRSWSLTDDGEPLRVEGEAVSETFFPVLQVAPALGRTFNAEDDRPGGQRVVILGHGLWASRFGSNPDVIGRTIHLSDEPHTIIGVMPRGFRFPDPDDQLWVPLALTPEQLANHGSHFLRVIGRLRPGETFARAQAQLDAVARQLTAEHPDSNTGTGVRLVSLRDDTVGDVRPALLVLLAVVGLVLLMVCANVGNLLLARATARSREFAIRAALGAGRTRVLRQLLTESTLLASIGGVLGLALAWWGIAALRSLAPPGMPRMAELGSSAPVYTFNLGVSLVAGLISGALPALNADRDDLHDALKDESRGTATGLRVRLRDALMVAETALGVVVLVGAGLLLRSFVVLEQLPIGFQTARILTLRVVLPATRYATLGRRAAFYREAFDRIGALPSVRALSAISFLPLTLSGRTSGVSVEGEPPPAPGQLRFVDFRSVTPGYFRALSIPMIAGRDFAWNDTPDVRPVAIISERAARDLWPAADPIGRRLMLGSGDGGRPWLTVVGVVGNVRQLDLISVPRPALYLPATQDQGTGETLRDWIIQTPNDPAAVAPAVRTAIWQIDPTLPVTRVQTMDQVRAASLGREQFNVMLAGLLAVVALALAAVGLYGVTAYSISRRTRELGIRLALGASRFEVLALVIAQGAKLTVAGLVIGTIAALVLSRLMATLLYGIGPRDLPTFGGVALVLTVVSLIACYVPARRATRVDPTIALRAE
jgi:predicted permease